jgi:hypothetical protein
VGKRLRDLADLLLASDPAASGVARDLGVCLHDHYVAVVMLFPGRPPGRDDDDLLEPVFKAHAVPIARRGPEELLTVAAAAARIPGGHIDYLE